MNFERRSGADGKVALPKMLVRELPPAARR